MYNAAAMLAPQYQPAIPPCYLQEEVWTVRVGDIDHLFLRAGLTEAQEWDTRRLLAHARARLDQP